MDEASASQAHTAGAFSRRQFLRGLGTTAVTAAALGSTLRGASTAPAKNDDARSASAAPLALKVNGELRTLTLEPRVTLLEAIRVHAGLTGPKETCDRGTCGACTVLLDGMPVYACMMLAVEGQGREVTTIEGISRDGLTPLQQAFVEHDGLQCGYCTPGFVMSLTALLKKNPRPTETEVRGACAGHLCRCGSYPKIFAAALAASART
ncbi:MAG TPA: (2Fe-2S)-binding protein [Opitutaceae bacterium]|nr:(2Fe-2S)-binding protein [Opitutaceae bacterium]